MPGFERKAVIPNGPFVKNFLVRCVASWIPTGFRWFAANAMDEEKELGRQIRAFASIVGDARLATEQQRFNVFLVTARGAALDLVGKGFGFERRPGELDDTFARRIAAELVADRVTANAIELIVELASRGLVNAYVYEPAQDILFLGDASPLSGRKRFANDNYYHGGVFEVQTDGPVPDIDDYVQRSKAAGTHYWLAIVMEGALPYNDDELAAIVNGQRQDFVTNSFDVLIESVGTSTDFEVVSIELPTSLEVPFDGTAIRGAYDPLRIDNLSKNYLLVADMLASSISGSPVYFVQETDPFSVWDPTDVQAAPDIQWSIVLGDPGDLGDPGLVLGP
jgi:hypothetical protein